MTIHSSHKIGGRYGNSCEHCGCGSQTLTAQAECVPSAEGAAFAGEPLVVLTAQPQDSGAPYRVAYDGRIVGDDRGFSTLAACEAEIDARIAIDLRDAARYDRPILYRKEGR